MTEWYTIPAKFTTEEKRIIDKLRDRYGLNHNQSLKLGVEILARLLAMIEYYVTTDNKTIKKIGMLEKKHTRNMERDVKKILEKIPLKEQEAQLEKLEAGIAKIFSQADNIFVKDRKRGRKSIKRKRGRPRDTGIE